MVTFIRSPVSQAVPLTALPGLISDLGLVIYQPQTDKSFIKTRSSTSIAPSPVLVEGGGEVYGSLADGGGD